MKVKIEFPFLLLLAVVFTAAKLTGHIAWSWWWVTSPAWIPVATFAACGAFAIVVLAFVFIWIELIDALF